MAQFDITLDVEVNGDEELSDEESSKLEELLYTSQAEKAIEDILAALLDDDEFDLAITVTNVQT